MRSFALMALLSLVGLGLGACGDPVVYRAPGGCETALIMSPLVFNELMSNNEGAHLDEFLETEDYIEIVNVSERVVQLEDYEVGHVDHKRHSLPELTLQPKQRVVLHADGSIGQGPLHLPLRFSSGGETLQLWKKGECQRIDAVTFPSLADNHVFARYPDTTGEFTVCRYASAGRDNGAACEAPFVDNFLEEVAFDEFQWPVPFIARGEPLDINEVALPESESVPGFVELVNTSAEDVDSSQLIVTLSPQAPGAPWPAASAGVELPWPSTDSIEPGQMAVVELRKSALDAVNATRDDDLVVSVFERSTGVLVTRIDFMSFPRGATLARPELDAPHVFCHESTPGVDNACSMLAERALGSRARYLRTASDFDNLARGGTSLSSAGVKCIVDLEAGGVVHLLSSEAWDLHYTFAREVILGEPHLNRCIAEERVLYDAGWWEYSRQNYFQEEGRRFFGATLVQHSGSANKTLEFAVGDQLSGEQMREAFFMLVPHTLEPQSWGVRPQVADQVERARSVEGTLPLVGPNEPFSDIAFQPLTVAVGFGVLEFVPARDLLAARLGPDVIVISDDVPNDIPLVGGLITEAFQTPLSHVNVLSQNRGTPNMALANARNDPRIVEHLGQLVRLEVTPVGFSIEPASAEAATAFWEAQRASGQRFEPRLDLEVTEFIELDTVDLSWLPVVGGKAAQFAELYKVAESITGCGSFRVPPKAFVLPVSHFWEHAEASGARQAYLEALQDATFAADYQVRGRALASIRELILQHPVNEDLLDEFQSAVAERFGDLRIRLRSSSNAEDLPGFNGAGLYTSVGVTLSDSRDALGDALRTVWASLYSQRAHDEREFSNIDHRQVAMAVLVHEAFSSERARGVGVSRNVLDPVRSDVHYINAQAGEATVTNPAPGVTTEQVLYERLRSPPLLTYRSHSNLIQGAVLEPEEIHQLSCALAALNNHYSALLDPTAENPYFAVEVEFKFVGAYRDLLIKQARQHPIISNDTPPECRMF